MKMISLECIFFRRRQRVGTTMRKNNNQLNIHKACGDIDKARTPETKHGSYPKS